MSKKVIKSYEEKKLDIIFGIFGVGDSYLNDDLKNDLKETINRIYEDGFDDGQKEKDLYFCPVCGGYFDLGDGEHIDNVFTCHRCYHK